MQQPELGQKIMELRKQKGLTQEELVQVCNISVRTIQRIEAGEVSPRSYTVKTILDALDYDFDAIQFKESKAEQQFKELFLLDVNDHKQMGFLMFHLKVAWVCGIAYFLAGVPEAVADWQRFFEGNSSFSSIQSGVVNGIAYVVLKVIVLVSYVFFMRGMIFTGTLLKNYLLKISAFILIFMNVLFYGYDIVSIYAGDFDWGYIFVAQSVCYGIGGIFLGSALLRLEPALGIMAQITGGSQIISAVLFLTVFLGWLGYIFLIPAVLLQIILLYKTTELIKAKQPKGL